MNSAHCRSSWIVLVYVNIWKTTKGSLVEKPMHPKLVQFAISHTICYCVSQNAFTLCSTYCLCPICSCVW